MALARVGVLGHKNKKKWAASCLSLVDVDFSLLHFIISSRRFLLREEVLGQVFLGVLILPFFHTYTHPPDVYDSPNQAEHQNMITF